MKPRFFAAAWSELCGEEHELVLQQLSEAGRQAAREAFASEGPGGLREEGRCFDAYRRTAARSLGSRWASWEHSVTRDDLRAAAFCVAFADERRRLLGLPPVPIQLSWLVRMVAQAERLYFAAVLVCECRQARSFRLRCARSRAQNALPTELAALALLSPDRILEDRDTESAFEAWRRAGDLLALALMRLNLRTAGQGSEIRRLFR